MIRRLNDESGFTFIELCVVMAIIGILTGIGSLYFMDAVDVSRDTAAITDARNFVDAATSLITDPSFQGTVNLFSTDAKGNLGVATTDGSARKPVYKLSPGVRVHSDAPGDPAVNNLSSDPAQRTRIYLYFYHERGTPDDFDFSGTGLGRRCAYVILDEVTSEQSVIVF